MADPILLAENFFNVVQYPSHVIVAEEELAGHEALQVGNGRRHILNYWTATTNNSDTWIKVTCDRLRAASCVVIDRGHNLAGKVIRLECSNDDFTTTETPVNITMPSVTGPGSIDDALGVRTEEGAWILRFPVRIAKYWRLFVPAMGANLKPQVVGLYLGLAYAPPAPKLADPWDEDSDERGGEESESNAGWRGGFNRWNRRMGILPLKFDTEAQYDDEARLWIQGFFRQGAPAWLVMDRLQSDRAVCAIRANGVMGWAKQASWVNKRQGDMPWIEHEPKAA